MRDEWINGSSQSRRSSSGGGSGAPTMMTASRSSQGLTRVGRQQREMPSLTLSSMAMKLKSRGGGFGEREVSERRQVGDAESMVNPTHTQSGTPWWRNVGMEEGM